MNIILVVLGIVFFLIGIGAYAYTIVVEGGLFQGEEMETPYRSYAIPLFIGGIVLILVGAFLPPMKKHKS